MRGKKRVCFVLPYRLFVCFLLLGAVSFCLTGCTKTEEKQDEEGKLKVVATVFAEYDFLKNIAGDQIDLTMLLKPGADLHTFDPTPKDMTSVQSADLFVTIGGESDAWAEQITESVDSDTLQTVRLMDLVDEVVEEETVQGMQEESDDTEEKELDEHVWTSPKNAIQIVQGLTDILCELDTENEKIYQENSETYIKKLESLDRQFTEVVNNAERNLIIVADRFPFRYFADAYGLEYYAAFPGCSTETDASAETVSFLIDTVKSENIPVVFHVELSSEAMCDTVCEETGAKKAQLNAVHNVSKTDFEAGKGYYELMQENVSVLEEALN
ncbi:MAG: metal ABC transporter substrate-binding protein [Clostridiaceae bacterium]|nr:metal ABC transporter substrate-binding protein [Clostridiaceae bacterium]